ncbi:PP2C family protein-serine/threonine phosphatase [Proteus mirabilis]|uniref:PP2C family protein-serine/threonine phosphatase n=1 Tax=Proteus mirabilis TaxID=584 RepID=UPI002575709F|nr:protein phosphatase 2C domain-containing protein [Proteus mirabilis]WJI12191.1 protein phosphatase 2C domain-containing protein [Proteus mirabilis]
MMELCFFACSHQGARPQNQDKVAHYIGDNSACFILCDGVAGHKGGEIAASLSCQFLLDKISNDEPYSPENVLLLVKQLQQYIQQAQQKNYAYRQMQTTLVTLFIDRKTQQAHWVHVGDSRLYLFRHGYLSQVTSDHSLTQKMKEMGYQMHDIPDNLLMSALGSQKQDMTYSAILPLYDGDAFLLCSDGFWKRHHLALLEHTLRLAQTPEDWLLLINHLSQHQPQDDNYSAIAVWVGSPQESTLLQTLPLDEKVICPAVINPFIGDKH